MDHVGPLPREHGDIVLVHPNAMRQRGARPRDADRIEIRDLVVARLALHRVQLERRFGRVRVNGGPGPLRQVTHGPEQRARAARREAWGEAVA